jgi:hypothetical protein
MPRVADAFDDLMRSSDAATVAMFTYDAVVRGGGVDAARRPGQLPAHRCGELFDHHDPRVHF